MLEPERLLSERCNVWLSCSTSISLPPLFLSSRSPTRVPESTDNAEVSDGSSLEYDEVTPESLQLSHQSQMPNLHTISVTRGQRHQVSHQVCLPILLHGTLCCIYSCYVCVVTLCVYSEELLTMHAAFVLYYSCINSLCSLSSLTL